MKYTSALVLVALVASASAWEWDMSMAKMTCGNVLNCNQIPGAHCDHKTDSCNLGVCPTDGSTVSIQAAGLAGTNYAAGACSGDDEGVTSACYISTTVTFSVAEDAEVTLRAGTCSVPFGDQPTQPWDNPMVAVSMDGSVQDSVCQALSPLGDDNLCYDTGAILETFKLKKNKVVTVYLCGARGVFTLNVLKDAAGTVSPGTGEGDPHFTGFDGRPFDFSGVPGAIFNVVSAPTVNVNAALVPELVNGLTYMGAVGVTTAAGHISVTANADSESLIVEANDVVVDSASLGNGVSVERVDAQTVNVETDALSLTLAMRHNKFVDITRAVLLMEPTADNVHGVLGQTAAPGRNFAGFSGAEEEYFVSSLFGNDFAYNRFTGASTRSMASNGRVAKAVLTATATNNDM